MASKKIQSEIGKIQTIVSGWETGREISDIERELVLDKLKLIYEAVMFLERDEAAEMMAREVPEVCADGPGLKDEILAVVAADEEKTPGETQTETPGSEPEKAPERPPIDRRAILSLYECGAEEPAACTGGPGLKEQILSTACDSEEACEASAPAGEYSPDVQDMHEENSEKVQHEHHASTVGELFAGSGKTTVGEAFCGNGKPTVGDTLARNASHNDVASKIAAGQSSGLRGSIGLNDKFLLVRDLFDGDQAAYDAAIDAIEAMPNLDEAMIYLHEHYAWNPNGDGVKLLVELLTRKFS